MREAMGQVTIIGEKEKSFGIEIEATYRIDSPFHVFEEIHDGRPSLWVFDRGKITSRFIEEKNDFRLKRSESLPIYFDAISGRIGFKTQCPNGFPVDRHPSFDHHPLGFPPRSDPSLG
jgi:hypothetical protein